MSQFFIRINFVIARVSLWKYLKSNTRHYISKQIQNKIIVEYDFIVAAVVVIVVVVADG